MLSKTALHALRAMTALAELPENTFAGAADVAKAVHAPRNYLGKLLQTLAQAGLVESQKGKGGGFRLARPPAAITVFDVVEPIDHVSRWQGCFMGRPQCSGESTAPCIAAGRQSAIRIWHFCGTRTWRNSRQPAEGILVT